MIEICFVCTGNRCRSPFAALYLESLLAGLPVRVTSVGTLRVGGEPVPKTLVAVADGIGLDLSGHSSIPISDEIAEADLVLGLERSHVAAAVVEAGAPAAKTFTLGEFARLVQQTGPVEEKGTWSEMVKELIAVVDQKRRQEQVFVPGEDVQDPFGGGRRDYDRMVERVSGLCKIVAGALKALAP